MTVQEFSDEFDVLYNSITSNQAPGLDLYEKSVFLTKAQDEILKAYFDPAFNKSQKGFDENIRRQIDFSSLIKVSRVTPDKEDPLDNNIKFDTRRNTKVISLPTDALFIINEKAQITRGEDPTVIGLVVNPLSYVEYNKLMDKPYKRPTKNQAWRVITGGNTSKAEIIIGPKDTLSSYIVRYVKRPNPIILEDLSGEGVSLGDNKQEPATCELDPILHPEILQRAVELAKAAYAGTLESIVGVGNTSQTEIGAVARSK